MNKKDFEEKYKDIIEYINGCAYPSSVELESGCTYNYYGLTKRELFAAMAMQGMLASETSSYNYGAQENLAANAVRRADALLAELNKGKEDSHE